MIAFLLTQPVINATSTGQELKTPEQLFIDRLLNNEVAAFNQLYKMYAPNLLGVIMKIVNQQETAEDLLQETFLKIKRYLPIYDEKKAKLFTWMLNISRNTAFDHLRLKSSRQSKVNVEMQDHHSELESFSHSINTDTIGIKKILNQLTTKQKTLLELSYYQGYTHQEIAIIADMPVGSVKTTIRQAILKLRSVFFTE
jgi:RNA polymerase sigma factor (sigma-70 family)